MAVTELPFAAYFAAAGAILLFACRFYRPQLLRGGIPIPEIFLPALWCVGVLLLQFSSPTYDFYLYNFDAGYGFQASYVMHRLLIRSVVPFLISLVVYSALPLAIAVVYLVLPGGVKTKMALAAGLAGIIGSGFYRILPASGPVYIPEAHFPQLEPILPIATAKATGPLNAIPSLHTVWALLLLLFSKGHSRRMTQFAWFWLVFTVCSTLGFGQHYLIDLVVAVPFAFAVKSLVLNWRKWKIPAAMLISIAAFMAILRCGYVMPLRNRAWLISAVFLLEPFLLAPQKAVE